jgi:hypothetical protein
VKRLAFAALLLSAPAWALSPDAEEFIAILKQLEHRDAKELRSAISRQRREAFYRCE